jgi:hypothetical protein
MTDVEGSGAENEVPVSPGGVEGQEVGTVTPPAEETETPAEIPHTPAHDKTGEPAQTVSEIHERATEDEEAEDE